MRDTLPSEGKVSQMDEWCLVRLRKSALRIRSPRSGVPISDYWSPEQIAGYLRANPDHSLSVCHETIYQFVYGAHGRERQLGRLLPSRRRGRRRRYARRPRGLFIPLQNTIDHRPLEIGERTRFGDWEGDLMIFRREYGTSNVTSLIERRSRYMLLSRTRRIDELVQAMGSSRSRGSAAHLVRAGSVQETHSSGTDA